MSNLIQLPVDGVVLTNEQAVLEILANTPHQPNTWIVLPDQRLTEDFFHLHTTLAGTLLQKFVNYQVHVAILGHRAFAPERSQSFQDFLRECNRGSNIRFILTIDELQSNSRTA